MSFKTRHSESSPNFIRHNEKMTENVLNGQCNINVIANMLMNRENSPLRDPSQ